MILNSGQQNFRYSATFNYRPCISIDRYYLQHIIWVYCDSIYGHKLG